MSDIYQQLLQTTSETEKAWLITKLLLDRLPEDKQTAILAAAIPHWFDETILSHLLHVNDVQAAAYFEMLKSLSFIETYGTLGYTVHDLSRKGILEHLAKANKAFLQQYSENAYRYFETTEYLVESIYHQFKFDEPNALSRFKATARKYRNENNYVLAHQLFTNTEELIQLAYFETQDIAHEVAIQRYRTAWRSIKAAEKEQPHDLEGIFKSSAYLLGKTKDNAYPIEAITGSKDKSAKEFELDYLKNQLEAAKSENSPSLIAKWLTELGDWYRVNGAGLENPLNLRSFFSAVFGVKIALNTDTC